MTARSRSSLATDRQPFGQRIRSTGGFHHTNTVEVFIRACSSGPCTGNSTMSARPICTATSPKRISNTITASRSGSTTRSAPTRYCAGHKGKRLLYRQPNEQPAA